MKVTFHFTGPKVIAQIARLRGTKPVGQFLRECLMTGLAAADRKGRASGPVTLARALPAFRRLDAARVSAALREDDRADPVCAEVSRLVALYRPVLAPCATALKPAGLLRLDVRCPIEEVAASLAFRTLTAPRAPRAPRAPQQVTIH
jgi:hypothetical protein